MARKDIGKNIIAALKDMSRIFTLMVVLASVFSFFWSGQSSRPSRTSGPKKWDHAGHRREGVHILTLFSSRCS